MNFIYVAIVAAFLSAFGTWPVQEWRHDSIALEQKEAADEKRRMDGRGADAAAVGHEQDKAKVRTEYLVITERVNVIVKENFYAEPSAPACFDARGLSELAAAAGTPRPPSR